MGDFDSPLATATPMWWGVRAAWRISQTGVWGVAWRRQARMKLSFCRGA